jgi:hypothetical protein
VRGRGLNSVSFSPRSREAGQSGAAGEGSASLDSAALNSAVPTQSPPVAPRFARPEKWPPVERLGKAERLQYAMYV